MFQNGNFILQKKLQKSTNVLETALFKKPNPKLQLLFDVDAMYSKDKILGNLYFMCADVLRPVLYRGEPLQAVPHLHHQDGAALPGQEEERGAAAHLRHRRGRLPRHVPQ